MGVSAGRNKVQVYGVIFSRILTFSRVSPSLVFTEVSLILVGKLVTWLMNERSRSLQIGTRAPRTLVRK